MRRPFTTAEAAARGISSDALRWAVMTGKYQRVFRGVYLKGDAPASDVELALCVLKATGGVASHSLAGLLHDFDSVHLSEPNVTVPLGMQTSMPGVRRRCLDRIAEVHGYRCTDGLQTLTDLAEVMTDITWEHALEFALRKKHTTVDALQARVNELSKGRVRGVGRMRRVLKLRPEGTPPTESLLETLMVQLIRATPELPEPQRQVKVLEEEFSPRVDLVWPDVGVFIELDGEQHKDQPKYDARRETAVVAATGWLPGRFTWTEVTRLPKTTAQRLIAIHHVAQGRSQSLPHA